MASVGCATKCPQCGRSALGENYYKVNVNYIRCRRCGYNCVELPQGEDEWYGHQANEFQGYGVLYVLKKSSGRGTMTLLNRPIDDLIDEFRDEILSADPEIERSYLVVYKEGAFTVLLGTPSESFHLPYEEYVEKMKEKYGGFERFGGLVPIED